MSFEPEKRPAVSPVPARKSVLILTAIIGLSAAALMVLLASKHAKPRERPFDGIAVEIKPAPQVLETQPLPESSPALPVLAPVAGPVSPPDRTAIARQLIQSLSAVDIRPGELTSEKAEKWHRELEQLIEQGTAVVPPLQEFFESHADLRFDSGPGTNLLAEPSLRIAFIEVLFNIPTPDNVYLQEEVLRTTNDPAEVALLARQLEAQEPGKYRELIIATARVSLAQAKGGQWPGRDSGPLVKILRQYGDESAK